MHLAEMRSPRGIPVLVGEFSADRGSSLRSILGELESKLVTTGIYPKFHGDHNTVVVLVQKDHEPSYPSPSTEFTWEKRATEQLRENFKQNPNLLLL